MTDDIGTISKCYTVTYHRASKHSAERLWHAITDPDEIAAWMGAPAKVDLRAGGAYIVDFHNDGKGLDGVIVRVEDRVRLGYVWGWSYVEWEIEPTDAGCRYTFVQNGSPIEATTKRASRPGGMSSSSDSTITSTEAVAPRTSRPPGGTNSSPRIASNSMPSSEACATHPADL